MPASSRMAAMNPVFNASINTLSSFEPEYVSIALTLTCLIATFYILFLWRFFSTYLKWIAWPWDCCGILKRTLLLTPLIVTTQEYDELQDKLHAFIENWCKIYRNFNIALEDPQLVMLHKSGGDEEFQRMDDSLKDIYNSYKLVIIENIKETQETRFNTVQSIKKVNESRRNSRVRTGKARNGRASSKSIEMKTFHYTETEPLLF